MPSPGSEAELLARARTLAGRSVGELAASLGRDLPSDLRRAKGLVGMLVELHLGAAAGSLPAPDFPELGVELKTLPVDAAGRPRESTFVCGISVAELCESRWETSRARQKLARVLFVPVEAGAAVALPGRRIGAAILWSPDAREEAALRDDWDAVAELARRGCLQDVTGDRGACLQVRPKAANGRVSRWSTDELGEWIRTPPRGFYLRAGFTEAILRRELVVAAPPGEACPAIRPTQAGT